MGVQETQILERIYVKSLSGLRGHSKHGRYEGLNEILVLKLLWKILVMAE
jgi:hypothetical protein